MAAKRNPRQIARGIQGDVAKLSTLRRDRETGRFSKADERTIKAAIKRLDKAFSDLKHAIHPFEFGRR